MIYCWHKKLSCFNYALKKCGTVLTANILSLSLIVKLIESGDNWFLEDMHEHEVIGTAHLCPFARRTLIHIVFLSIITISSKQLCPIHVLYSSNATDSADYFLILCRYLVGQYVTIHDNVISHVNITNALAEDGGLYTCEAKNAMGSIQHSARLNIYGKYLILLIGFTFSSLFSPLSYVRTLCLSNQANPNKTLRLWNRKP